MNRKIYRLLRWWFKPAQWIDGLRNSEWSTDPVKRFRAAVWQQVTESTGVECPSDHEQFAAHAHRMKWRKEWRGMYLRSQGLLIAWYAVLALELAPLVVVPFALIWWMAQHLTVTIAWS